MSRYLPEELELVTISNLQQGETGYTHPGNVLVDESRRCWIRGDNPFFLSPQGDATLKIRLEGNEIFAAQETVGDYRYYVGGDKPMDAWEPIPLRWE